MRRRARTDGNHAEIVSTLRTVPGVSVHSTAAVGSDFPDLVVGFRGRNYLFEVKDPKQPRRERSLRPGQREWHARWTGQVHVVHTVEDCLDVMGASKQRMEGVG